jgi:hypothetical protein
VDNPLETNPAREHRVRERAYHLWEAEGKPYGRDVEYWERARELIGMEDSAGSGLLPNPETHPGSVRETGIEEADIQENLGEFPDRLTDQGEVQPTPTARRSPARTRPAPVAAAKASAPTTKAAKPAAKAPASAAKSPAPKKPKRP